MTDGISRIAKLTWHLQHNHFPPLGVEWIDIADTALQAAERGEYEHPIKTPAGDKQVREILDGLHLWPMLSWEQVQEADTTSKPVLYDGVAEDESELFQVVGVVWMDDDEDDDEPAGVEKIQHPITRYPEQWRR